MFLFCVNKCKVLWCGGGQAKCLLAYESSCTVAPASWRCLHTLQKNLADTVTLKRQLAVTHAYPHTQVPEEWKSKEPWESRASWEGRGLCDPGRLSPLVHPDPSWLSPLVHPDPRWLSPLVHPDPRWLNPLVHPDPRWLSSLVHPDPRRLSPLVHPKPRRLSSLVHPDPRRLWSHLAITSRGLCSQKPSGPPDPKPPTAEGHGDSDPAAGQGLFKFKELYENPWTVPNLLCVCRIALAPCLAHLIMEQHFHLSLALFTLAGATDLLDGYIARTWPNQKSALGSALDPLADKILISVLYLSLTAAQLIPAPLTVLVLSRDAGLIAAVFWVRYKTVPPPVTLRRFFNPCYTTAQLKPTLVSKVNTAIQLFLVAASLAAPVFHYTDCLLLQALWYITAVTTAASGYSYYHYGKKTVEVLKTRSP